MSAQCALTGRRSVDIYTEHIHLRAYGQGGSAEHPESLWCHKHVVRVMGSASLHDSRNHTLRQHGR